MRGCIRIYGRLCCYSRNGGTRNHCPQGDPSRQSRCIVGKVKYRIGHLFCPYTADPLPFKVMELCSLHLHQEQSSLTAGRIQRGFGRMNGCFPGDGSCVQTMCRRMAKQGGALGQNAPRAADHKCETAFRLGWTHSFLWKESIAFSFGALYRAVHGSRPQREKTCWKSSLTKSRSANALRLLECVEKTDYNPSCFWYCASSEGEQ